MNYLLIFGGATLGMLLWIVGKSYYVQQSSKYELGFLHALKVYTTKYVAPIIVGYIIICIAMFVFPDIISNAGEAKEHGKILQNVLDYLRAYSVVLGMLSQGLGFLLIRKGEKFLKDEEEKLKQ